MHLSEESTINLVDCHGEEDGELFFLWRTTTSSYSITRQTSVSAADSQGTSAEPAQLVETAHKDRVPGQSSRRDQRN